MPKTTRTLQISVRLICASAFFLSGFVPIYVPHRVSGEDIMTYELLSDQFLLVEEGFVMKTASISEAGHRLAYSKGISHEVSSNESLNSIAQLYGISVETILWANDLPENAVPHPGDSLLILPVDGVVHTVERGQNLAQIATLYDIDLSVIEAQNHLRRSRIFAGQELIIPGGTPLPEIPDPIHIADTKSATTAPGRAVEPAPPKPTQAPAADPPPSYGIFQKPCECVYTQYYHPGHYAVDLAAKKGSPIFAAEDGIVIRAEYGWNGGYGNVIEIDHGNGLVTLYAHNETLHVREGSAVRRGDVISSMGNSGRVYGRTGVHVHFEVVLSGVKKNPVVYLQ